MATFNLWGPRGCNCNCCRPCRLPMPSVGAVAMALNWQFTCHPNPSTTYTASGVANLIYAGDVTDSSLNSVPTWYTPYTPTGLPIPCMRCFQFFIRCDPSATPPTLYEVYGYASTDCSGNSQLYYSNNGQGLQIDTTNSTCSPLDIIFTGGVFDGSTITI